MAATAKVSVRDMAYVAIFAALLAICSWISIPTTVPFTMQTFGVFLTVGLLGGRRGTLAVLVYILLAAVGVPVLAGFTGGLGFLLGSTGGYILGFILSALLMWGLEHLFGHSVWALGLGMVLGAVVLYFFGTVWFMVVYTRANGPISLASAFVMCVVPFLVPEVIKIGLALSLTARLRRYVKA